MSEGKPQNFKLLNNR